MKPRSESCRCPTPCDEPIQRTEGAQRGDTDKVEPRYTTFKPVIEDRNRHVRLDFGPERWMNHRQLVDIYLVSSCQEDVIGAHPRAVRDSCIEFPVHHLQLRYRLALS